MIALRRFLLPLFLSLFAITALAAEPLPVEQAFRFSARALDAQTIEARWQIADGYYLYRDKLRFAVDSEGATLGTPQLPAGKIKEDAIFGKVETYRGDLLIRLPVQGSGPIKLKATAQGCWDEGICYPPHTVETTVAPGSSVAPPAPAAAENETSRVAALFHGNNVGLLLLSFFGFGVLLALTPCMFPMIPILSGIIVNHGHAVSHARAFVLSLAYVLGMAVTYAVAGVAAGLSGTLLSAALQNPWVLGVFALVFVVLSLSMFGFYELQLPTALQSRLSTTANRQGGSLGAIALMGGLSALIVGPCVAAPLAGALLYIAKSGNAVLGGAALFVMALGMGAPLLLVGAFSRHLLPKSGPWMEGVKKCFGVIMLATALWLVAPVIPVWVQMLGWALLLILPAIFLHALDPLPPHAHGWQRLGKGFGVILLLGGAAMLAGVLGGARDPLQPLGFLKSGVAAESAGPRFERVRSVAELDARLASAKRPVMLDFYADWCVSCKEMERFTFADPKVAARLQQFVLLQADVTANSAEDAALLKRFGLFGPPGIIFFTPQGKERDALRVVGYEPAERFLPTLDNALQGI